MRAARKIQGDLPTRYAERCLFACLPAVVSAQKGAIEPTIATPGMVAAEAGPPAPRANRHAATSEEIIVTANDRSLERLLSSVSVPTISISAARWEHEFKHDRAAPNETDRARFTLVNAAIAWRQDYAPLAARDIRVGLSVRI